MSTVEIDHAVLGALQSRLLALAAAPRPEPLVAPDAVPPALRTCLEDIARADTGLEVAITEILDALARRLARLGEEVAAADRFGG